MIQGNRFRLFQAIALDKAAELTHQIANGTAVFFFPLIYR